MLSFKSNEWFRVRGRGFVASIQDVPDAFYERYYHPHQLVNEKVKINGEVFLITGAEVFMIGGVSPEHPYSHPFGLLVKEL